jgi:3-hydroxyisobutyrate dehydrogenase
MTHTTKENNQPTRIGFIGLGLMGKPMALNLLKHGYEVLAFNRTKRDQSELESRGAKTVASPKEVAASSDVVIDMVTDASDVEEVLLGRDGVFQEGRRGLTVVDMSTNSPETAMLVESRLSEKEVDFLDAPVSGGDKGAREGTLTIMIGGNKEVFARCLPIFEAMGKHIYYMGKTGSGQATKLANQVAVAIHTLATSEALLLGSSAGLELNDLLKVLTSGAASSWNLSYLGPKIVARDFEPGFKAAHLQKDLKSIMRLAERERLTLPASATVYQLFNSVLADSNGEKGTQILSTILEKLSNRTIR